MATIILVPGAGHPAWCWHRIVPLIEAAGHRVQLVDLPGTGENRSIDPGEATLAIWSGHVADAVRGAEAPVLLAGHSRGGFVISEAAEQAPDALAGLIYIAAVLPRPGLNMLEAAGYDQTIAPPARDDGCREIMAPEVAARFFYNRCSADDAAEAHRRLFGEPLVPGRTPSGVTPERWARVPRAYIECSDDNALPLDLQRRMQIHAPCDPVILLDSDHSPFFSAPRELADAMLVIAKHFAPD